MLSLMITRFNELAHYVLQQKAEMNRPTLKELKKEALLRPEVKAEYERLAPAYLLRKKLIGIRIAAGFTQEQMARALKTQKSNISRLENVNSKVSPTLSTIERYAHAAGYRLEINFLPETKSNLNHSAS